MEIGNIINISNFTDLTPLDISTGWSIDGGKLISLADSTKPAQFSYVSGLFYWKKTIITNKKTTKLYIYNLAQNYYAEFNIDGANKLNAFFSYTNSRAVSTSAITFTDGDLLEYSIEVVGWKSTFKVKNLTTGLTVSLDSSNVVFSIHKLRVICPEITEISKYNLYSSQNKNPDTLLVGDSISWGSQATSEATSWGGIAGFDRSVGAGDRTQEALQLLPEILNVIKPKRVIYAMGTNDLDASIWRNGLQIFKKRMNANRITFIPCCPYANNNRDMSGYKSYIISNFDKYFNFFDVTKAQDYKMKPEYNWGDGVHPNQAGHTAIGNYVVNDSNYSYFKNFNSNIFLLYSILRTSI